MKFSHILLPTDLSDGSRRAYKAACDLARENGAKITLLSVVEDLKVAPHGAPFAPPIGDPDAPAEAKDLLGKLQEERKKLAEDVDVHCDTAIGNPVGNAIAWYAKEHSCDVIAMSTQGYSGLKRLFLGSTAEEVLRHAEVPVLCLPPAASE